MKKAFAVLGSLMIIVGLKAQKEPAVKKETTPAVKQTAQDSVKAKSQTADKTGYDIKKVNPNAKGLPSQGKDTVKPDNNLINAWPKKYTGTTKPTKVKQ